MKIYYNYQRFTHISPLYEQEPLFTHTTESGQQRGGSGLKSTGLVSHCKHCGSKTSKPK